MSEPLCRPTEKKTEPDMQAILYEHKDHIFRLCRLYLGSDVLAEDAFQETMLKCWQHYDSYRAEASLSTWLSHIAVNVCKNMLRSNWFRLWMKSDPIEEHTDVSSQEITTATDVRDAVMTLPGIYREVTVLFYFANLTTNEIAHCLHISDNTVSTRLRRARALLKRQWKEDDVYAR